jgi:hypothetical protein
MGAIGSISSISISRLRAARRRCGRAVRDESYQCCECGGNFDVDWGEGTVTPCLQLELSVEVDDVSDA